MDAVADAAPLPLTLTAETWKSYEVPPARPDALKKVALLPVFAVTTVQAEVPVTRELMA